MISYSDRRFNGKNVGYLEKVKIADIYSRHKKMSAISEKTK